MKKLITLSILTYLLFTINSSAENQSLNNNSENGATANGIKILT